MSVFTRFLLIGIGNTAIFFIIYQILYFVLGNEGHWPTVSWSLAWVFGSLVAHYTHKKWTFKSNRDIRWTLPWTIGVYVIGLTGSTITYDILLLQIELHHQLSWLASTIIWGLFDYLGLNNVAFKKETGLSVE